MRSQPVLPGRGHARLPGDREFHVIRELLGLDRNREELHAGLCWRVVLLLLVAGHAADDDVLPDGRTALSTRDDVVVSSFRPSQPTCAVLALAVVPGIYVLSRELDRPLLALQRPQKT